MRQLSVKTTTVQIGNSDNKLRQVEWAEFVQCVGSVVQEYANAIHFFGGPENWAEWQKACWVFDCEETRFADLKNQLAEVRKKFRQDSVALTRGETEFV